MATHRDIFQKMQALLKGQQRLAIVGKRNNKWEPLFQTEGRWDFDHNSLRCRISEAAHKDQDSIVINDSTQDSRFMVKNPEFCSCLCLPITLPGDKQVTIFVEDPERTAAFAGEAIPRWRDLAHQLETLKPAGATSKKIGNKAGQNDDQDGQQVKSSLDWPKVIAFTILLLGLGGYTVTNFLRSRAETQLTQCSTNIDSLVTASNMYARDHQGKYPKSVNELIGTYMLSSPVCPAAGKNTYQDLKYTASSVSVSCSGGYHRSLFKGSGDPEHWPFKESKPPMRAKKKH